MKVLIADDDPTTRYIIEGFLSEWGYTTESVEDGDQAMEILENNDPPRLALLDWLMPGIDGPALCKRIKEDKNLPFIYMILVTSKTSTQNVVEGLNSGADDFLKKPVDIDELRSRLAVGVRMIKYEEMLLESERNVRVECYEALSALAETRDNETGEHLKRSSMFCRILAESLGMDKQFVDNIVLFAPMHDIGKVGIPDNILLAPRKLNNEEFDIMKTHTSLGFQILENRKTLEMAANIAHHHHENYNGKGYPKGLKGNEIPMSARIAAVVDVYDALRSKRHYKESWTHENTVDLIKSERGEQFDPTVTDVFLKEEGEFANITDLYNH